MVDMVILPWCYLNRIAEDSGTLPEWCVLVSLGSTLFDNLPAAGLILKKAYTAMTGGAMTFR